MNAILKNKFAIGAIIALALGGGIYALGNTEGNQANSNNEQSNKTKAIVYKTPTCGCCGVYSKYLEENGFDIETKMLNNLNSIKKKHGIARNMESCHTVVIDDYFIEGHVPIEAVNKILTEQPDIDGIALPEMPIGTPGMPGIQRVDWHISAIKDGNASEFMTIKK